MNQVIPLFDDFEMRAVEKAVLKDFFKIHHDKVFSDTAIFRYKDLLSEGEKEAMKRLSGSFESLFAYYFLIYKGDEPIGWTSGLQDSLDRLYMENTGILPEYQGKGLYSVMLPKLLEIAKAEGFQRVYSRHLSTNNAILVPKMKGGFMISAMELSEKYGLMIQLTYYFNPHRRNAFLFRAGQERLTEETAAHFKVIGEKD